MKALQQLGSLGGDIRQIAKLLQAKAPPGHKLAYINEEEAALLKRRGGSGRITEAGIPSYEGEADFIAPPSEASYTPPAPAAEQAPPGEASYTPPPGQKSYQALPDTTPTQQFTTAADRGGAPTSAYLSPSGQATAAEQGGYVAPNVLSTPEFTSLYPAGSQAPGQATLYGPQGGAVAIPDTGPQAAPQKPSFFQKSLEAIQQPENVAKLGIAGIQAGISAEQMRRARSEAQAAKAETQALAAPYQQMGQQLTAAATRGELTPANQQILQAAQAQAAQGVAARGGVGTMQAQNQIAALTQQLLANQFNLGQQTQLVGDKIAQGAIQAGVQADQYINQLTANYTSNIARTLYGLGPSATPGGQPVYDQNTGQRIS